MKVLIDPMKEYAKEYSKMISKIIKEGEDLGFSKKQIAEVLTKIHGPSGPIFTAGKQ